MINFNKKKNRSLNLDTSELSPAQERLIRYIHTAIIQAITTSDEAKYFEEASESVRMLSNLIKQANFTQKNTHAVNTIPYSTQALEFCVETITEAIEEEDITIFDN